MKQLKMLLLTSMVMLFTACGGGGSTDLGTLPPIETTPPPTETPPKLSYIDLTNASSLIISPNSSVYQSKGLSVSESTETNENIVLMVTDDGYVESVTFTDEEGAEYISISNPLYVENIDNNYLLLAFGSDLYNIETTYLIRKSDGSMYDLDVRLAFPNDGFKNRKVVHTDSNGNIYLLVYTTDYIGLRSTVKIDITNPESLTKTTITSDVDNIENIALDNNTNLLYYARNADNPDNAYNRIQKANGGLQNISLAINFWKGLDGILYSLPFSEYIVKHEISDDYTYTATSIDLPASLACNITNGGMSYIIYTATTILITDWDTHDVCEVYNNTMIPRKIETNLSSTIDVQQTENYYYIAGNNDSNNPVLRRFNPLDDTYIDMLSAGEYDVYKFTVSATDEITFNALRMSDGRKVIGEISPDGVVTIIESEANAEIIVIEAIN